jgi:Protein of unknown function (DUF1236).
MLNGNRTLAAGLMCCTLALFSPANAESNVSDVDMTSLMAYIAKMNRASHTYNGQLAVGMELPAQGMTYYDIPAEYKARDTQYTIVNGKPVLVDAQTHKVVRMMQ